MYRRASTRIAAPTSTRTTRHAGYAMSQTIRKRIEEANGWIKCVSRSCPKTASVSYEARKTAETARSLTIACSANLAYQTTLFQQPAR